MHKQYICPDCKQRTVEEINTCGSSSYFCNSCKKLIAKSRVLEENGGSKKENK